MNKIEEYSSWVLTLLVIIYIVFLIDLYHYSLYLHDSSFFITSDFSLFFTTSINACHEISFNILGIFLLILGPIVGSFSISTHFKNSGILQNQLVEYYNVDQVKEKPKLNFEYPDTSNLHAKLPDRNSKAMFYVLVIFLILVSAEATLFIFASGNNTFELRMSLNQILVIILYSWAPSLLIYTIRIVRLETMPEYFRLVDVLFWIAVILNIYTIFAINSNLYCN